MKLYFSDTFELPLPEYHRFPMAKYRLFRERLLDSHLSNHCELLIPSAATDEQLKMVHTEAYLNAVKSGEITDLQIRRIGFPWSEKMVERSRRSTGASIAAARAAIQSRISESRSSPVHSWQMNDVCLRQGSLLK